MAGLLVIPAKKPDASSGDADDSATPNNLIAVPQKALAIDGALPKVGETVELQIAGKVTAINGETYVVEATSANDEPIEDGDADTDDDEEAPADDERTQLMNGLKQGDQSSGY